MNPTVQKFTHAAILASLGAVPLPGVGQAAAQEVIRNAPVRALENVVVTARRVEESLQETPVAVTAFSRMDLERRGIEDVTDLDGFVPNLQVYATGGSSSAATAFIRGIGQNNRLYAFEPGVGFYLDDAFLGRPEFSLVQALDIERIEVLRGPQGTLYGRNTNGGAILIHTRAPSAEERELVVGVTLGNYSRKNANLMFNTPLGESTALRVNLLRKERDGFVHNLADGSSVWDEDVLTGRAALRLEPTESLTIDVTGDATRGRSSSVFGTAILPFAGFPATKPLVSNSGGPDINDHDSWGASIRATLDLSKFQAKSITSYRTIDFENGLDSDGTPLEILDSFQSQTSTQTSQEFQISGAIGDRIDVVLGVFLFKEESETFVISPPATGGFFTNEASLDTIAYAMFGNLSYSISPRLAFSVGVRQSYEEKEFDYFLALPPATFISQADDNNWNSTVGRIGLDYQMHEDLLLYVSYSEGFKSGGFNPRFLGAPGQRPFYDPETVGTLEGGLKWQDRSGALMLNAALFYNDFDDYQANVDIPTGLGFSVSEFTNAAAYTSYGAELELFSVPAEGLTLGIMLSYFDGSFDDFMNPGTGQDLSNNDLQMASRWNGSVVAEYRRGLGDYGDWFIGGSVTGRSSYYTEVNNNPALEENGYFVFNARAGFEGEGGAWRAIVSVNNITDEAYLIDGTDLSSLGFATGYYAAPRTIALTLEKRFR